MSGVLGAIVAMSSVAHALFSALSMAFAMAWEILWPLILGFALSGVVRRGVDNGCTAHRHAPGGHDTATDLRGETTGRSRAGGPHGGACGDGYVGGRRGIDPGTRHVTQRLHLSQPFFRYGLGPIERCRNDVKPSDP